MKHTEIGGASIKVGEYQKDGKTRNRNRTLGTLMCTEHSDGSQRFWITMDQEVLNPSLLILARPFTEKGSDRVILNVFDNKPREAPAATLESLSKEEDPW